MVNDRPAQGGCVIRKRNNRLLPDDAPLDAGEAISHALQKDGEDDLDIPNVVNLDALVPREDFEVIADSDEVRVTTIDRLPIRDLEETAFFYDALRKPDFQRETANWSPAKVADLVQTFLDGDLVPAVILWQAGKDVFVIDGAHRLSALIAWVQNDYGDGPRSIKFFQGMITEDQKRIAEQTRKLIEADVGTYAEHKVAVQSPQHANPKVLERAKRLGILAIPIQWVPSKDAAKAESSFFKINQAFTAIDPTELRILRARKSATAIAARAVIKGGTGNKYWSHFPKNVQSRAVAY